MFCWFPQVGYLAMFTVITALEICAWPYIHAVASSDHPTATLTRDRATTDRARIDWSHCACPAARLTTNRARVCILNVYYNRRWCNLHYKSVLTKSTPVGFACLRLLARVHVHSGISFDEAPPITASDQSCEPAGGQCFYSCKRGQRIYAMLLRNMQRRSKVICGALIDKRRHHWNTGTHTQTRSFGWGWRRSFWFHRMLKADRPRIYQICSRIFCEHRTTHDYHDRALSMTAFHHVASKNTHTHSLCIHQRDASATSTSTLPECLHETGNVFELKHIACHQTNKKTTHTATAAPKTRRTNKHTHTHGERLARLIRLSRARGEY